MVVRQNVPSTIMLKNVKVSNENVRLQLATPEICQARNLSSNSRNANAIPILFMKIKFITFINLNLSR